MKLIFTTLLLALTQHLHAESAVTIDKLLADDWQAHGVGANPPASDETIVRRLYLDIAGRIPTLAETRAFLDARAPDKRARLIDALLASEGHVMHMFNYWADLLRVFTGPGIAGICGSEYTQFVKASLRANKPYDQLVRELLSARGDVWENPAIGYYMRDRGMPLDNTANTTRIFLGTRIECAQCHNHPFDKWTQMQFYQLASYTYAHDCEDYFSPGFDRAKDIVREMQKKDGPSSHRPLWAAIVHTVLPLRNNTVEWFDNRPPQLPHDYQYQDAKPRGSVQPAVLMGSAPELTKHKHTTDAFAHWLASPENPRFTRVIANRLWKKVFGLGLIEPVDEILDSTQPSHPALMNELEQMLKRQKYDLRAFLRVLCNTRAYLGEVTRAEIVPGMDHRFTGPLMSRLSAEQIWDSLLTLVHPGIDATNPDPLQKSRQKLAARRKLDHALELMPAEEMIARARKVQPIQDAQNAQVAEIQSRLAAARAKKNTDPAVLRALGVEFTNAMQAYHIGLSDHLIVPATLRLAERVNGRPAPKPAAPPAGAPAQMMTGPLGVYEHIKIDGYDVAAPTAAETHAAHQRDFTAEAQRFGIAEKERGSYLAFRFKIQPEWFRAAELTSPSPPGHALRELGQSDRETIENASTDASIPQALLLMNSPLMADILSPHSVLKRSLSDAASLTSQLQTIYLTLLSRRPTPQELAACENSGLDTADDLICALLNTRQFIHKQ